MGVVCSCCFHSGWPITIALQATEFLEFAWIKKRTGHKKILLLTFLLLSCFCSILHAFQTERQTDRQTGLLMNYEQTRAKERDMMKRTKKKLCMAELYIARKGGEMRNIYLWSCFLLSRSSSSSSGLLSVCLSVAVQVNLNSYSAASCMLPKLANFWQIPLMLIARLS